MLMNDEPVVCCYIYIHENCNVSYIFKNINNNIVTLKKRIVITNTMAQSMLNPLEMYTHKHFTSKRTLKKIKVTKSNLTFVILLMHYHVAIYHYSDENYSLISKRWIF
jgi:hypothetical protein